MHVLILPSWLPHARAPVLGIFTLEQAKAIAELRPEWQVSLVAWGQGELELAVRRPREWRLAAVGRIRARAGRRTVPGGLTEYRQPALSWDPRLAGGNIRGVTAAVLRAVRAAGAEHGAVDLVHAHASVPAGQVAMRLKRASAIPYVLSEHWSAPPPALTRRDGRVRDRLRAPHLAADATIAMSRAQASTIEGWGAPRPTVVPPAVDERVFVPSPPRDDGRTIFCTVCLMEEVKGVPDLLRGAACLLDRLSPDERQAVQFRIGGDGSRRGEYEDLARSLGLADSVSWLGLLSRDQVRDEMRACDCYAMASHRESFGVVYAEAMACGKPVVATRVGGPEDIVTEETGLLVDPRDAEALADGLEEMVRFRERFDPQAIRGCFERRFSRPAVIDALERVYRDVLTTAPPA